jgi:HK97 family phage prohead protease
MTPLRRTSEFGLHIKSVAPDTGDNAGEFKALVATFDVDSVGDQIRPGAFTKSLLRREERGEPLPVIFAHRWDDPFSHIGVVKSARETDLGLEVDAVLDLDGDNPVARQIHRLMRARRLKAFSFGYSIIDAVDVERDGRRIKELRELDLLEISPCLRGVDENAELLSVKAAAPPLITPDQLRDWAGPIPTVTPTAFAAWATERSARWT